MVRPKNDVRTAGVDPVRMAAQWMPTFRSSLRIALADAGRRAEAAEQLTRALTLGRLSDEDEARVNERLDALGCAARQYSTA